MRELKLAVALPLIALLCLLVVPLAPAQQAEDAYTATSFVSNVVGRAASADSALVNPWGMASDTEGGPWWVADEGRGKATVYSGEGWSFPGVGPLVVNIPVTPGAVNDYATPSGIVQNSTEDFELAPGVPSQFIFVTRDGSIAGWNSEESRTEADLVADNSPLAVYTGAALAPADGQNVLYVANFGERRIDAFGPDFGFITPSAGAFIDPDLPYGLSPYNVRNINGELWVTYAEAGTDRRTALSGPGLGYVDVFDAKGGLLLRLEHGPWLNAPWGVAPAPDSGFGKYSGAVLVGNSGSGEIAAFDPASGAFLGILKDGKDEPVAIPGLHGLGFGNGALAGPATTLYFTAASRDGVSLFGSIIHGIIIKPPLIPPGAGRTVGW